MYPEATAEPSDRRCDLADSAGSHCWFRSRALRHPQRARPHRPENRATLVAEVARPLLSAES